MLRYRPTTGEQLLDRMSPTILVLLNLSRDQLDRYGETDIILDRWKSAVSKVFPAPELVLDSTQEMFDDFPSIFRGRVFYFDADPAHLNKTGLIGEFNAKNVNAALMVSAILGFDNQQCVEALESFDAAYGRGESVDYKGKHLQLFLAKNPESFNNNLDLISQNKLNPDTLLFMLNDNIPDGRDVSWIYDIDPLKLESACRGRNIFVTGKRCLDMAARLKYAFVNVDEKQMNPRLKEVMELIVNSNSCNQILALPNYSSMLEMREFLVGRKIL